MLDELFTPRVLEALAQRDPPSLSLRKRLDTLRVSTEPSVGEGAGAIYARARRVAWKQYVTTGVQAGLMDADLEARLTGIDDDGFRSALSELMVYYFLTHELGLAVDGRPPDAGRPGKVLDFQIRRDDGNVGIEVKSPYADPPWNDTWSGDNAHLVEGAIDEANKQFAETRRNVLVVAPLVEPGVLDGKRPFMRALYGEEKVVITFERETGRRIGEPTWEFFQDGKLLKLWGGEPRFTRTGAVLIVREVEQELTDGTGSLSVSVIRKARVLHNPYCPVPIPLNLWGGHPQFVSEADGLRWTDGSPVND